MNTISISQLKINPSKAIASALDFPIAIENRNNVEAYLIGKELYELLIAQIENTIDHKVIEETNFNKGRDFESLAEELGV